MVGEVGLEPTRIATLDPKYSGVVYCELLNITASSVTPVKWALFVLVFTSKILEVTKICLLTACYGVR